MVKSVFSRLFQVRSRLGGAMRSDRVGPIWRGGSGTGVLSMGPEGLIAAANDPAIALLERRSGVTGLYLQTFFNTRDRDRIDEALAARGGAGGPVLVKTMGDHPRHLELMFDRGANGEVLVLMLDRTVAEHTAASLRREARTAIAAEKEARAESRANADLLADLSHEMRTPLNAVIGFAGAMQNETFGPVGHPKYVEYAGHIQKSGAHLMDLISSILDLAKLDADRLTLNREMVDLGEIAAECAAMVRGAADEAGLSLTVSIEKDLPESWLDARAVRQILINLLANAVKFTSDGGVVLDIAKDGDALMMRVTDTGVGMSEDELSRLGARFTSVHGEGVRGANGAGLGLALAFALTEAHDGAMMLDSAPGEGVKAVVRLPIAKPLARIIGASEQPVEEPIVLSQLDRIDAYRREIAAKKDAA